MLTGELARPESVSTHVREMPYDLDGGVGAKARIGLLVLSCDQTVEYEFTKIFQVEGIGLYVARLYCSPVVTAENLKTMQPRIAPAAALIEPGRPPTVFAFACTSGAMVIGDDTVEAEIRKSRPGALCTSPIRGAFAALSALKAHRIALITPYVDEINGPMREHMMQASFDVPVLASWSIIDDNKVARISPKTIQQRIVEVVKDTDVDAVFVSCTSLRAAEINEETEKIIGRPITASNHAMAWHSLRLAGYQDPVPGWGTLFRLPLT